MAKKKNKRNPIRWKQVGITLRKLRRAKSWDEKTYLKRTGIKDFTVTELRQIETGQVPPTSKQFLKTLLKPYGIKSLDAFFMLCATEKDVPKHKRDLFRTLMPTMKRALFGLLSEE